jgi:hypothetical protein
MKQLYTLKVYLPVDETYEKLSEFLRLESYRKIVWHSIAPPHKFEYHFAPLNERHIEGYKEFFRELYKDSKYKSTCRFEVEDYKE